MRVAILLASYNGAAHIERQLASIAEQTHGDWTLIVSDDGSTDATRALVSAFADARPAGQVRLTDGPGRGAAANFLSMLCDPAIDADAYAFCDQDDVWLPDRLARGIAALSGLEAGPALAGNATLIADAGLRVLGPSIPFNRPPCFANALVQSIAGGNTMLLNRQAAQLVRQVGTDIPVTNHDWWVYLLISGAGGRVIRDNEPNLIYRQHGDNAVGSNRGIKATLARIRMALAGKLARWNDENVAALDKARPWLTPANAALLDGFIALRRRRGPGAVLALRRLGLYRQTASGTALLMLGALLGKL